jgi:hypothetical protein
MNLMMITTVTDARLESVNELVNDEINIHNETLDPPRVDLRCLSAVIISFGADSRTRRTQESTFTLLKTLKSFHTGERR